MSGTQNHHLVAEGRDGDDLASRDILQTLGDQSVRIEPHRSWDAAGPDRRPLVEFGADVTRAERDRADA